MTSLNSGASVLTVVTDVFPYGILATHKDTNTTIFVHVVDYTGELKVGDSPMIRVIDVKTVDNEDYASGMI